MSLRTLTLTLGLAAALPLTAQAEIEVVGPVPAGQFASAYGVSLDILSLGATAVSAECRNGNGTPLATLPLTGTVQGQVTSLQFQTPFGFGTRVSCEAEGTGNNGLINIELNVLGWGGDPQVTLEGRNAAAVPGPEGPQGATGPQGEQGPPGADSTVPGPPGNDGEDGTSCSVAEENGTATVSCTDGSSAMVEDGAQGPEGPQGPTGPTGPPGDANVAEIETVVCRLFDAELSGARPTFCPAKCTCRLPAFLTCVDSTSEPDAASFEADVFVEGTDLGFCQPAFGGGVQSCSLGSFTECTSDANCLGDEQCLDLGFIMACGFPCATDVDCQFPAFAFVPAKVRLGGLGDGSGVCERELPTGNALDLLGISDQDAEECKTFYNNPFLACP